MNTERRCQPVFVVGMNGSGTSMMLDSLGRHPELYALPDETHMMPYIIGKATRFGSLTADANFHNYWQFAIDQMPALRKFNKGRKPDISPDWKSYPRTVGGIFDGIFSAFAADKGKRRWCEKTPDHVQHLPLLSRVFPSARFIHLIRDGREVACSISRRQKRRPELIIYRWKKLVAMGQEDGAKLGSRYMELKYEDLTSDPRSAMNRVCSFLDLEFSELVLNSRMPQSPEKKKLAEGELGQITQNPIKWPTYFDQDTVRRLEQIAGSTLNRLGYRAEDTTGDSDPSELARRYWRATDFLRLTVEQARSRRGRGSWTKLARNASFSFKQYLSKRH